MGGLACDRGVPGHGLVDCDVVAQQGVIARLDGLLGDKRVDLACG
jgi:hypothetical protein